MWCTGARASACLGPQLVAVVHSLPLRTVQQCSGAGMCLLVAETLDIGWCAGGSRPANLNTASMPCTCLTVMPHAGHNPHSHADLRGGSG